MKGVTMAPMRAMALDVPSPSDRSVVGYTCQQQKNTSQYVY